MIGCNIALDLLAELAPHPYLVIGAAYQNVVLKGANQSVLISGESGAGKTVTCKVCLEYLTTVCKPQTFGDEAEADAAASSGQVS